MGPSFRSQFLNEQLKSVRAARAILVISICFFLLQVPQAIDRIVGILKITFEGVLGFQKISRAFADVLTAIDILVDLFAIMISNKKYVQDVKKVISICVRRESN